ncbi:class I SAM-dependent methyltransferase [Ruegeria sp. HKCCA5491]|uniref:class I SAM-dependent methyltransferase n=1 Tax=Ruegeria sp. HKCCA5491 TaxID=2682986 RepID=UPI00148770E7|nr:class I SAM-dependent methyltransferase [Ruegeria sp. HKCCA5491]
MTNDPRATLSRAAKSGYVATMRGIAWGLNKTSVTDWLSRRHHRGRGYHWASSLMAIHDIDGLIALDVPWWTYDAIEVVDAFLKTRPARVFEYGAGASTIWAARRSASVTSVEHDADWYARVLERVQGQTNICPVDLRLAPPSNAKDAALSDPIYLSQKQDMRGLNFTSYASEIDKANGSYDLIIIDGRARQACLRHAANRLSPGGMIVFDNSKRARYREAISQSGLSVNRYPGLTPSLPYSDETSILTAHT